MKALFDTNILIDYLAGAEAAKREGEHRAALEAAARRFAVASHRATRQLRSRDGWR